MAVASSCLYPFSTSYRTSATPLLLHVSNPQLGLSCWKARRKRKAKLVKSTQSNVNLIKSSMGPDLDLYYDSYGDEYEDDEEEDEEEEDNDWLLDDEFAEPAEFQVDGKRFKSQRNAGTKQGRKRNSEAALQKNTKGRTLSRQLGHAKNLSRNANVDDRDNPGKVHKLKSTRYASDDEEDEEEEEVDNDGWLIDEEFAEPAKFQVDEKRFKSQRKTSVKQGSKRRSEVRRQTNTKKWTSSGQFALSCKGSRNPKVDNLVTAGKLTARQSNDKKYTMTRLSEEIGLEERWLPLLDYLFTLGLRESHFIQMYQRHMTSLLTNVRSAEERLNYLLSVGVRQRDIPKMLYRQPQILEYTVENNLKPHVDFLMGLGIPSSKIGQIISSAPSLFNYSIKNSLKPTVRYLVEEVGIDEKHIGKVVQLSPQILTQRIDVCWNIRHIFLSDELGASKESVVKMVTKHPQFLHYSIDEGLLPRIRFLRSIGLRDPDILKVLTSITQVLSLSLEDNLKPKYMYLINELGHEVKSLLKYPTYLSLSLDQRIRPRHKFLIALNKAPNGPFPLQFLMKPDEYFCKQCAGTTVNKYLAFRQQLLLINFAEKYQRR